MRLAVGGLVLTLVCAGCGIGATGGVAPRRGALRVVAAFYPLAEAARKVGGGRVTVEDLTPAGAEPHDLELKASQVADVQDAAVVLVLGRGFQPAVEKVAARRRGTVELLAQRPIDTTGEVGEGGTGIDPHVWLDPVLMSELVTRVEAALTRADPAHAADFRSGADGFRGELSALDGRFRAGLTGCARHEIVTAHAAFGRLAARYGLTQRGIAGLSPDAEPDPGRLASLADLVRAHGITTIFTETLVSPRVSQTLAREAGVQTDVLDPLEGLTANARAAGMTYVRVMDDDLQRLRRALGCP